jgi:hypothetical protein
MFNLLIANKLTTWETDQVMRMFRDRFNGGYSGIEGNGISLDQAETLKQLEGIDTLLMYEAGTTGPTAEIVRYGHVRDIRVLPDEVTFCFEEKGRLERAMVLEFKDRLGFGHWEEGHTHWAIKDGGIPSALLDQLKIKYDVVFSFAGEDRKYVEKVAGHLAAQGVRVFYDKYEEVMLWGKDLAIHLDHVYQQSSPYCVLFISKHYVERMWTRHEWQAALARALKEKKEYILPARFDDTEVPGIRGTLGHISLVGRSTKEFADLILQKLRKA